MTDSLPSFSITSDDPESLADDLLVITTARTETGLRISAPGISRSASDSLLESALSVGHCGEQNTVARVPAPRGIRAASILLIGLGSHTDTEPERQRTMMQALGAGLSAVQGANAVTIASPGGHDEDAVVLGALLGTYRFTAYLTRSPAQTRIERLTLATVRESTEELSATVILAEAVARARDLVNQPPNELYPASFANAMIAQVATEDLDIDVEIIDDESLRARGFGGMIGVGSGSVRGPRLVKMSYRPTGASRHLALVGKGITFDSGGISIKPAARMENMKSDMAGAAAAAQVTVAVARLALPVRVTAWLALAENMPSGSALRPADVLTTYGGTTVEVTNTDAEGRLVLADALVAAQEEQPDLLVDIATLTGAQVAALGRRTSGVMGTDAARSAVLTAAGISGEPMWGMPIPEEMISYFDSNTADLKNAGAPAGGMLAAAAFLREFIGSGTEWAHLDIAGPAYNSEAAHGYTPLGGTGVPVRTLIALVEQLA